MESPLDVVLLLDGVCMPASIEWASNHGCDELISFLLEADSFRYKIANTDTLRHLKRLVGTYLSPNANLSVLSKLLPPAAVDTLSEIIDRNVPLKCAMSGICEHVWGEILNKFSTLPFSPEWRSFRQIILSDVKLDFTSFIMDASLRRYFEEYLIDTPDELTALCCWRDAREIITAFEKYKVEPFTVAPRRGSSASSVTRSSCCNNLSLPTAIPMHSLSWSGAPRLTAATTAALGSIRRPATYLYPSGSFADDAGALKLLLSRCLALSKRYFGAQASATFHVLGLTEATRLAILSTIDSVLSNKTNTNYKSMADTATISTAYLASLISMLDQMFIRKTVTELERLLHVLEKEIVGYIKANCLGSFQGSVLFVEMVAEYRGRTSNSVSRYVKQKTLLEKVRKLHHRQELRLLQQMTSLQESYEEQEKLEQSSSTISSGFVSVPPMTAASQNIMNSSILHWNDADACGSVYISYHDRVDQAVATDKSKSTEIGVGKSVRTASCKGLQEVAAEAGLLILCIQGTYESLRSASTRGDAEILAMWSNNDCYDPLKRYPAQEIGSEPGNTVKVSDDVTESEYCSTCGTSSTDTASLAYFSGYSSVVSGAPSQLLGSFDGGGGTGAAMSTADADWHAAHNGGSIDTQYAPLYAACSNQPTDAIGSTVNPCIGVGEDKLVNQTDPSDVGENAVPSLSPNVSVPVTAENNSSETTSYNMAPVSSPRLAPQPVSFYSAAAQAINASFSYFRSPDAPIPTSRQQSVKDDPLVPGVNFNVEDMFETTVEEECNDFDSDSDSESDADSQCNGMKEMESEDEKWVEADGAPERRMSHRTLSSLSSDQHTNVDTTTFPSSSTSGLWCSPNSSSYSQTYSRSQSSHSLQEIHQINLNEPARPLRRSSSDGNGFAATGSGSMLHEFSVPRLGTSISHPSDGNVSKNVLAGTYGNSSTRVEELVSMSLNSLYCLCCPSAASVPNPMEQQLWLRTILNDILAAIGPVTEKSLPETTSLLISSQRVVGLLDRVFPELTKSSESDVKSTCKWRNVLVTVHFLCGSNSSNYCCSIGLTTLPSLVSTLRNATELALQYAVLYKSSIPVLPVLPPLLVQIPVGLNVWNRYIQAQATATNSLSHLSCPPLRTGVRESITDMYLDGHFFPPPAVDIEAAAAVAMAAGISDGFGMGSAHLLLSAPLGKSYTMPTSRFIGEFDMSLADLVHVLGLPMVTKLILLVLMDRSVILVAHSQTLITVVMNALPRLIYPFRLLHVFTQCHTVEQLQAVVVQLATPDSPLSCNPVAPSVPIPTSPSATTGDSSKLSSSVGRDQELGEQVTSPSSDCRRSDCSRTSSPSLISVQSTQSLRNLKPLVKSPATNRTGHGHSLDALCHSCPPSYIIGTTSAIFQRIYSRPTPRGDTGPNGREANYKEETTSSGARTSISSPIIGGSGGGGGSVNIGVDVESELSYKQLIANWIMYGVGNNMGCVCDLDTGRIEVSTKDMLILERSFHHVDALEKEISRGLWSSMPSPMPSPAVHSSSRVDGTVVKGISSSVSMSNSLLSLSNSRIERAFFKFLFDLLLRYLPEYVVHFPRDHIIGCNIDKLLTNILIDNNSVNKSMFLAIVESKSFLDLVKRHGISLE